MKPNTRILNYIALIQDGVLTLDDVPQDIKKEVTKWVRYLAGIKDESMVKDESMGKDNTPVPKTTPINGALLPKGGE